MSAETNNRYSDKDLAEFKTLLQEKIKKAEHDLELIKSAYMNDFDNGTDDTSPTFKAFEEGQLKKMEYPEENLYYVCGPPMHNLSVMKLLDDYGVPRESIILDDFGS